MKRLFIKSLLLGLILGGSLIVVDMNNHSHFISRRWITFVQSVMGYGIFSCFLGLLYAHFYNEIMSRKMRIQAVLIGGLTLYLYLARIWIFVSPGPIRFDVLWAAFVAINFTFVPISYLGLWLGGWSFLKLRNLKR